MTRWSFDDPRRTRDTNTRVDLTCPKRNGGCGRRRYTQGDPNRDCVCGRVMHVSTQREATRRTIANRRPKTKFRGRDVNRCACGAVYFAGETHTCAVMA